MNQKDVIAAEAIVKYLLPLAAKTPPPVFRAYFTGAILANIVGPMPEDYWREFVKVEPCGRAGCECHIAAAKMIAGLQGLRDDLKKTHETFE